MKYIALVGSLLILSNEAVAATSSDSGQVGLIRSVTESHYIVEARGNTLFRLDGVTLTSPCSWLMLKPEDKPSLSILLSAKAMKSNVTAFYKSDIPVSWNSTVCAVENLDI